MLQKGFGQLFLVSLIAVILVSVLAGIFIVFKNNQSSSTNNQTVQSSPTPVPSPTVNVYTNKNYGFSFEYPLDWKIMSSSGDQFIYLDAPGSEDSKIRFDISPLIGGKAIIISEYAKYAASQEVQGFYKRLSYKEVTTDEGVVGYETIWAVSPPPGAQAAAGESLPITYFPIPTDAKMRLAIYLNDGDQEVEYLKIIKSLKFLKTAPIEVTYKCNENKTVKAVYKESTVSLTLNNGQSMDLPQGMSGSGVRYVNSDESFVFWSKGEGAFIEENGKVTYADCVAQ